MPERPFRFALAGQGNIARKYAAALRNVPGACLAGAIAVDQARLAAFCAEHGIPAFAATLAELAEKAEFDAAILGVPSGLHGRLAAEAAALGKHVLTEKPLEISVEKADAMIAACARAGVRLGCAFQQRADPRNIAVRQALQGGALGRVFIANAFLKNRRGQDYYDSAAWRGTWALDGGGPFAQQAAHTLDLMAWMMGPPLRVAAQLRTVAHRIEVEDMGHAIVRYANGAQGVVEASTVVKPGYPNKMEFHGEKGTIVLSETGIEVWDVEGAERPVFAEEPRSSGSRDPMAIDTRCHERVIADFILAVREDRDPMVSPQSARIATVFIEAIYRAAREGRAVDLAK